MISIIKHRKIWYVFSGLLVGSSVVLWMLWGLQLGIDFTGGSLLELQYKEAPPTAQEVQSALSTVEGLGAITVQPIAEQGIVIRLADTTEETHQAMLTALRGIETAGEFDELRFDSIGPSVGRELWRKAQMAIVTAMIAIILYIAWAFRKVSKPVSSWKYGVVAVITLFHDVLITIGAFALLGRVNGVEIDAAFIAAILTVFGYSVNDTIVVFDRIRENLRRRVSEDFERIVDISVSETMVRSINTSFTALLALFAILIFGGGSIHNFVLALIIGISFGTFSSIFVASPLLVTWHRLTAKK